MDRYYDDMASALSTADDKEKLRDIGIVAAASIWLVNVIDAALGWPAAEAGVSLQASTGETGRHAIALTVWR